MRYLILALLLTSCTSPSGVDMTGKVRSWGRHHGAALLGYEITYPSGIVVGVEGGRQFAVWAPGEPHQSSRAPEGEWQGQVTVSVPIWR